MLLGDIYFAVAVRTLNILPHVVMTVLRYFDIIFLVGKLGTAVKTLYEVYPVFGKYVMSETVAVVL